MNFQQFIDQYKVYTDIDRDLKEIVTIELTELERMLSDLYTIAYNDGLSGSKADQ